MSCRERRNGVDKSVAGLESRQRAGGSKRRVLIVDDDPDVRFMFQNVLEYLGYVVVTAENGMEALREVGGGEFAGVLLDYSMPGGMSGLNVLQRLREEWPGLPVIMVNGTKEVQSRALETGAKAYLSKPVNVSDFKKTEGGNHTAAVFPIFRMALPSSSRIVRSEEGCVCYKNATHTVC